MKFKFKTENKDVNERKLFNEKLKKLYPDKIPIICEKDPRSKFADIDKTKFLIPKDLFVAQFILLIRKRIEINSKEAFFLITDKGIVISKEINTSLGEIYEKYANENDGFLYLVYAGEEIWGGSLRNFLEYNSN